MNIQTCIKALDPDPRVLAKSNPEERSVWQKRIDGATVGGRRLIEDGEVGAECFTFVSGIEPAQRSRCDDCVAGAVDHGPSIASDVTSCGRRSSVRF